MKRLLALLLCLVMCVTMIPAAYAEDIEIVDVEEEDLITLVEPEMTPGDEKLASKPTITTQPTSKTAYVGTTVKFKVVAENADSYQWYWRKNASASWARTTATGNKTATLSLEATTARNGYQYKCGVKNSAGTTYTNTVTLTVSEKPVITTQPTSKTAAAGNTVNFTVKADGAETYQWYYRKSAEGSWVKTTLTGAKTAALSVPATEARNGYQYRCVLKNAKGTTYSKAATLTVTAAKPSFTTHPLSYTAGAGAYIYFKIKATGADSYQWQYRKSSSGTWYNSSSTGNKTATLTVKATEARSGYQFRCKAFNDVGTGYSKAATLTVSELQCGDKLTWKVDSAGLLTIGGSGEMNDYLYDYSPFWYYSDQIKRLTIGGSVTHIGDCSFIDCSSLTSVTISDSVTSIGEGAFMSCDGLTSISIPSSVTSIGDGAFCFCLSLTSISVSSGSKVYSSQNGILFNKEKSAILQYPAGKAGDYTIPGSVAIIGNDAFCGCSSLTSVTIPDSVTSIGEDAFSCCDGLTSVTIPNSVKSIEFGAFSSCNCLTNIMIPSSVNYVGTAAFSGCTSLTTIRVNSGNPTYRSQNGVLFSKDMSELLAYPGGKSGAYTIPSSVESMYNYAFRGCSALTSVTIPDSVTIIDAAVFYGCSALTSVTIPVSVTEIGGEAFSGCDSLTDVNYKGSKTQWGKIDIYDGNEPLLNATMHYNA